MMFQLKWIWQNLKGWRAMFIMGVVLSVFTSAISIVNPKLSQLLVDHVIVGVKNADGVVVHHTEMLFPILAAMVGVQLGISSLRYLMIALHEKASQNLLSRLRGKLYDNLQRQDMRFYDTYRTGDLMTRLTGDLDLVRYFVAWDVRNITDSITLFTATIIYFFTINWQLTLALAATAPFIFVVTYVFSRRIHPLFVNLREKLSQLNTAAQENISGNRVVKAFNREDHEIRQFQVKNGEYRETNLKIAYTWLTFSPVLETLAQSLTVITVLLGGILIIKGQLTYGELMAFSVLTWALANPMRLLGQILNDVHRFSASASKVIELYYARPGIRNRENVREKGEKIRGGIVFDHVAFRYGSEEVFRDLSFEIRPGETVGIMGPTGSGKTTIANLIARFYDVSSGSVRVDGVDVRDYPLCRLRASVGMATQDVFLFSDTIDGNIAYGDPEMPEEMVRKYARAADADGFIRETTDGYNTIIGERGVGLSGGQKQRLALARALAIRPPILILDDTTSAVDMETERLIQQNLSRLDFECTKIIIAQRVTSIQNADQIIMLGDHGIEEMGTHAQLLKKRGSYYDVYCLQQGIGEEEGNGAE